MRVWLCVVVSIHLFVKIFKKLMCHIVIGGCKVGVLHRLLIEFIYLFYCLFSLQKSLSSTALHFPLSLSLIFLLYGSTFPLFSSTALPFLSLSLIFLLCLISYCGLLTWTVDAPVVADLAWGGEESVAWGWWLVFGFLLRFGSGRLLFVPTVPLWFISEVVIFCCWYTCALLSLQNILFCSAEIGQ